MSATAYAAPPTTTERRVSLSRGPALIVGTILLAAGLYFLYKEHTFPRLGNFPNGAAPVHSHVFLGVFGANGWTGMLTAIAGGLLLFGAAEHFLAKAMSLIVGVALGAAAIIALISGNVLGLAAANGWTELGWGVAALILLFNVLLPARRRVVTLPEAAVAGGVGAAAAEHPRRRFRRRGLVAGSDVAPAGRGAARTDREAAGTDGQAAPAGEPVGVGARGGRTVDGEPATTSTRRVPSEYQNGA